MSTVELSIPTLGNRFVDYREGILGDSYNWGPTLQADKVKYFAFHHSVTPQTAKNDGNWKAECDRIASEHVNGNGWGGVGYRFIICSNGVVAYVGDLSHGGSAVANHNDVIISACMIGDFTKQLPTDKQIQSAHDLADWFINHMPQYPLINDWDKSVIGHKDAAVIFNDPSIATACPGSSWPNDMKWRIKTGTVYTPQPVPTPPVVVPPVNPPVEELFLGKPKSYWEGLNKNYEAILKENTILKEANKEIPTLKDQLQKLQTKYNDDLAKAKTDCEKRLQVIIENIREYVKNQA